MYLYTYIPSAVASFFKGRFCKSIFKYIGPFCRSLFKYIGLFCWSLLKLHRSLL